MSGVLDARDRDEAIRRLAAGPLDVLVIGGGITGAGAALDAASRGLRVGLVEARDLAAGTSSRSSKLIHGGLRYLEQGDFKLVREALRERDLLVSRLAPHLVRPVPFLYPLYRKVVERPYVGAGLVIYDAMEGIKRPARTTGTCPPAARCAGSPRCGPLGWPAPCSTTTPRSTTPGTPSRWRAPRCGTARPSSPGPARYRCCGTARG